MKATIPLPQGFDSVKCSPTFTAAFLFATVVKPFEAA